MFALYAQLVYLDVSASASQIPKHHSMEAIGSQRENAKGLLLLAITSIIPLMKIMLKTTTTTTAVAITRNQPLLLFLRRPAVFRPSVYMLPGIGRCGAGLLLFPTASW